MKISEYIYDLPQSSIAKYPPKGRGTTKLLVVNRTNNKLVDAKYSEIPKYINKGDVIVLNETKVEKRRTYFQNEKGRNIEVLFLNKENNDNNRNEVENVENQKWYCLVKGARHVKLEDILTSIENPEIKIQVLERKGDGFIVTILNTDTEKIKGEDIFEKIGHTPIPPYMRREDTKEDYQRYNTVFAHLKGSVAAPTASLNLTDEILAEIEKKGVRKAFIELQIGWGTFSPIREENIKDHKIHKEMISVSKETAEIVNEAKKNGGKIWAFGTTVARTLESIADRDGYISEYTGDTELYIYPSYKWKCVDHLITNFHMPDSTLMLLVSSFGGKDLIKKAYNHALENDYKFLSYGDSMVII
ncbi:MAG: tRNA preQ1(34) S-adenosylmethionine ribosyltransferase-isomerase QueA [Candidatus Dojkabacteria bacterium]|jgi:S-adenosylmethionine:tRNA ribosyltransferase-isomerase